MTETLNHESHGLQTGIPSSQVRRPAGSAFQQPAVEGQGYSSGLGFLGLVGLRVFRGLMFLGFVGLRVFGFEGFWVFRVEGF